jgi:hypothetical protein
LTVRSRSSSREIDQYGNLTVRCLEIAASSLPKPALHLDRVLGVEHLDAQRVSVGASAKPLAAEARFWSASRSGSA